MTPLQKTLGILSLPDELMLIIIKEVVFMEHLPPREAHILSHVSRRWRRLVLHCPILWTNLTLHAVSNAGLPLDLTRASLERSGDLPITIYIVESTVDEEHESQHRLESFLRLVLPHSQRWKRFAVDYHSFCTPHSDSDVCPLSFRDLPPFFLDAFRSPTLEALKVDFHESYTFAEPGPDSVFWTTVLAEANTRFPTLRDVSFYDFIPSFASQEHIDLSRSITSLEICLGDYSCEVDLNILASYLQTLPSLDSLSFDFSRVPIVNWRPRLEIQNCGSAIVFPKVSQLEILVRSEGHAVENIWQFLDCCQFPNAKDVGILFEMDANELSQSITGAFRIHNHYPSLEKLSIAMSGLEVIGGYPLRDINLPFEKIPSLKELYIGADARDLLLPVRFVSGTPSQAGRGQGSFKFPALRSLRVGIRDPAFVKDWITNVVEVLKAQGDWDSFELLSIEGLGPLDNKLEMSREDAQRWLTLETCDSTTSS